MTPLSVDKDLVDMLFTENENMPSGAPSGGEKTVIRVAKKPVTATVFE